MPRVLEANPDPGVKAADVDPVVVDLGQLVGLLVPDPANQSDYTLNQDWFKSPFAATEHGIKQNPQRLADLLGKVLQGVGGNAKGIPAQDPALLGSWYPIPNPAKKGVPTDLNVVAYPDPNDKGAVVFGFGALLKFEYNLSSTEAMAPTITGPKGIRVEAWALAPLLRVGPDGVAPVVSKSGYPLSFGIAVEGTDGSGKTEPIISAGQGVTEFSFDGAKFGAAIDLSVPSADVSIVVLSLRLPGEEKGVDRTLADLKALTGSQIMEVASTLFISALSDLASESHPDIAEKAGYLLPVVGLSKYIPGQGQDATVPQLPWWELFNSRESVTTPFIEWFTALTSDMATTRNWLFSLGKLLGVGSLTGPSDILGAGTRESPLMVPLIDLSASVGTLAFTSGTDIDKAGIRHFYPGLTFTAKDVVLAAGSPPPAVLRVQADLELAEFKLTTTPQIGGLSSLKLSTYFALENGAKGKPLFEGEFPAGSGDQFVFGRVEAGLSLDATANIQPLFQLIDVELPTGKFPTIDLMSPDQLAAAAEGALNQAIQTGLKTLFGLVDGGKQVYLETTAAVVGVLPPPQAAVPWPAAAPQPPFGTVAEIEKSIKDPIGAVAGYLHALLDSDLQIKGVDGADHTAFTYVLWMFADVLREAAAGTPVGISFSGEGTPQKPWRIALAKGGSDLPANLTVFKIPDPQNSDVTQLYLGAELDPAMTAGSAKVQLTADVCLVRLDLPKTGCNATVGAQWLPGVQLALGVPDGFQTPTFANSYFKVGNALVSGSWSREKSWGWRLLAETPTFNIDGVDLPFAKTLDWSDQDALKSLVTQAGSGFANVLIGTIGVALTHAQTRAGTALTGVLGLLPDPTSAPNFPPSLKSSWQAASLKPLAVGDLKNPWSAILSKLENDYASSANATAVLGLLGWVLNPDSSEPPVVGGAGSVDSPYKIPLDGSNFELLTWFVTQGQRVGLGLGRTDQFSPTKDVQVTVETQLEAGELSLADGSWTFGDGVVPSLAFRTTLANPVPGKNLFEAGDPNSDLYLAIQQLQLGFRLSFDSQGLAVEPLVDLINTRLPGQKQETTYEFLQLGQFKSDVLQAFESALNQVVGYAIDELLKVEAQHPAFRESYDLLSLLGLTIPVKAGASTGFGINTGGWNGLVADPLGYLKSQTLGLLAKPTQRKQFVNFVSSTLGIKFPEVPPVVADALSALGFLGAAENGYPVNLEKLLNLASNPFQALRDGFEKLVNDESVRAQLAAVLTNDLKAPPFPPSTGMFAYKTYADGRIELSLLAGKVTIGEFVGISGTATFNIVEETLSAEIAVTIDAIQLALVSGLTYKIGAGDPTVSVEVQWTNDGLPSAGTLPLFPFDGTEFLDDLADIAPGYVLSTVVGQVMEGWILNQGHPVVDKIFEILGLASVDAATQKLRVRQLQGLLKDPEGWFLSNTLFGSDGSLNLKKLKSDFEALGALNVASKQPVVGIRPYTDPKNPAQKGLQVYGFPYGFGANLTSDGETAAAFTVQTENHSIASGKATIDLIQGGLSLGPNYQPGIIGDLRISGALPNGGSLFVDTSFDTKTGFELTVGQQDRPAPLVLPLYPFAGWGALAAAIKTVAAQLLIDNVPKLVDALKDKYSADPKLVKFLGDLETAGSALDVSSLANGIAGIKDPFTAEAVLREALSWLVARFESEAAGQKTAQAIQALLSSVITSGLGVEGGTLTYQPSDKLPLKLYLGADQPNNAPDLQLGLWAGLTLPDNQIIRADVERAGVGFDVAALQNGLKPGGTLVFDPKFVFGVGLQVPVERDASGIWGPRLDFAYVPSTNTVPAHFAGHFDPIYNSANGGTSSSLSVELFPHFFATNTTELETWLLDVVKQVLPRYASAVILNTDAVKQWLGKDLITGSNLTAFKILEGTTLVQDVGSPTEPAYILSSITELESLTPEKFVGGLLYAAFSSKIQILKGDNYGLWIEPESPGSSNLGVRVQASDLTVGSLSNLKIQLGAEDREWIVKTGGKTPPELPEPGLSFYVPVPEKEGQRVPEFDKISLNLVNVGVDYGGKGGKPLVDLSRFQLAAVKPRVLFTLDFSRANPVDFGGSLTAADIAISLAPNRLSGSTGGKNQVAQNLVGGGSDTSGQENPKNKDNPPTNPGFSLVTGYWKEFYLNFLDAEGKPKPQLWFPVQRAFGPIYANMIGVGWEDDGSKKYFDLLFDGSLSLAAFQLYLKELSIGVPIHDSNDPSFGITNYKSYKLDLAGFELTFQGGPVSLDGGFLRTESHGVVEYTGFITVKAAAFSLFGAGSYGTIDHDPSLFVFAALDAPLGGVPAFFINGVAAGFAYNRGLKIPAITGVQDFPLVKGAIKGTLKSDSPADANQALAELVDDIYPEIGEYWLAAGIKFTSFELLDCFALLFIQFGRRLEFDLLGVASLPIPKGAGDAALAYAELALKIVINPSEGIVSVEAQLTPNSYVITKECRLTGGFAFYLWLKNITVDGVAVSAGEFVVTLGGYHPAFQKPKFYPDPPRLGFNWPIELGFGSLTINGGTYFALVPTAVMAGGFLHVNFKAGPVRAWLDAQADFIISWKPFYFDVGIAVEIGVALDIKIGGVSVTLKVSIGAKLHLLGPPTHGSAEVEVLFISFTIPIGDQHPTYNPSRDTLDWSTFAKDFLPPATPEKSPPLTASVQANADRQQVLKTGVELGLISDDKTAGWTVASAPFVIRVDSAIPVTLQPVVSNGSATFQDVNPVMVGIQPMNLSKANVALTLSLTGERGPVNLSATSVVFTGIYDGSPKAAWGSGVFSRTKVPDGSDAIIKGTLKGLRMVGNAYLYSSDVGPFPILALEYSIAPKTYLLPYASQLPFNQQPKYKPAPRFPENGGANGIDQAHALAALKKTIMTVADVRNRVFQALEALDVALPGTPDLSVTASQAQEVLQAPPVLAHAGVFLASSVDQGSVVKLASKDGTETSAEPDAARQALHLLGVRRSYLIRGNRASDPFRQVSVWEEGSAAPRVASRTGLEHHAGTVSCWGGEPRRIVSDGGLPLRVACFDENEELLADQYDVQTADHRLPEATAALAVKCEIRTAEDAGLVVGWSEETELLRVNARFLLGDGFAVRPEGFAIIRRHGAELVRGLIDMAEVRRANTTTGGRPAGFATLFRGGMRSVAVLIGGEFEKGSLRVALERVSGSVETRHFHWVEPAFAETVQGDHALFYDASSVAGAGDLLDVWVKYTPEADCSRLKGVYASAQEVADLKNRWEESVIEPVGVDFSQEIASTWVRVEGAGTSGK